MFNIKTKLHRGSSLIEVLVSLGILGLGIGGVLTAQTMGLRNNQSAFFRTQANILLSDMSDRLRNNSSVARSGDYVIDWGSEYPTSVNCNQVQCNSDQVRQYDLAQWTQEIRLSLPDGEGKITSRDNNVFLLEVRWQDKGSENSGKNACEETATGKFCLAVQVQI